MKPESMFGRAAFLLWLALCVAVLLFAFVQRGVHDMPVAAFWLIAFLSIPIGLFAAAAVGYGTSVLSQAWGVPYEPFLSFLPIWLAAVGAGYLQWFAFAPWLGRKVVNHLTRRSSGSPSAPAELHR